LGKYLKGQKKGALKIEFYDREFKEDDPAFVSFDPLTLNVDRKIWADAKAGEEYARYVIAHEVGHIVLHDHHAKSFSKDPSDQLRFADDGQSAEWQANTFARHFLLPDPVVQKIRDMTLLASLCLVPEAVALERILAVKREQDRQNRVFGGGFCSDCGNFSLVP